MKSSGSGAGPVGRLTAAASLVALLVTGFQLPASAAEQPTDPVAAVAGGDQPAVLESGALTITPRFTAAADDPTAIADAELGLLDQTKASVDDPWYAPDAAVIHLSDAAWDDTVSAYRTSRTTDTGREDTTPQLGFEAAIHSVAGPFLTGDYDQLNGAFGQGLVGAGVPQVKLVNLSGPSDGTVAAKTIGPTEAMPDGEWADLWDGTALLSGIGQSGRNVQIGNRLVPSFFFSSEGQYCLTFQETIPTKTVGTMTRLATYTIYVGALPEILATCDQADAFDPDESAVPITTYDGGHTDLRVAAREGELSFGMGSTLVPLSRALLGNTVGPVEVPEPDETADYTAIGEPGTPFWYFPVASTTANNLWPGFSTESVSPGDIQTPVTFTLRGYSVDGQAQPDGSEVVLQDGFSGSSLTGARFDSGRGVTSFQLGANVHSHPMWAFTQPGLYCLNLSASAVLTDGQRHVTEGLLTMAVGDEALAQLATTEPCEAQYPDASTWPTIDAQSEVAAGDGGVEHIDTFTGTLASVSATGTGLDLPVTVEDPEDHSLLHAADLEDLVYVTSSASGSGGYRTFPTDLQVSTEALSTIVPGGDGARTSVSLSLGEVQGPGEVTLQDLQTGVARLGGGATADSYALDIPDRTTGFQWQFSAAGVYCVPLTVTSDVLGSTQSVTKTLTFAVGAADASTITTCTRGQQPGAVDEGGGDDDGSDDVWDVANGSTTESGAVILNDGHVDVASLLEDGELITRIKDTTISSDPVYRDPAQTVLQLLPSSRTAVPSSDAWSFLGAAGDPIWMVTQTQQPGLLWPGWSTEEIAADATQTGFTWTLDEVSGPGQFTLFESTGLGAPEVLFSTRDGLPDTTTIAKGTHAHGSWAFSAEGVYCLDFTRSTTLADASAASDAFTLAVAVGRTDVRAVDPSTCAGSGGGSGSEDPGAPAAGGDEDEDEDVSGAAAVSGADGASLPVTGSTVNVPAAVTIALLLVVLGVGAIRVQRRRVRTRSE